MLVAAPLGAGLCALVQALRERRFEFSPEDGLPEAARNWPVKTAAAIARDGLGISPQAAEGRDRRGLIIPYDIMRVVTQGYGHYDYDPVIGAVLDTCLRGDGVTDTSVSDTSAPGTSVSGADVPDTSVAGTSVAGASVAGASVLDTSVLDGGAPLSIITLVTPRETLFAQFLAELRAGAYGGHCQQQSRTLLQNLRRFRERIIGPAPISLSDRSLLLLSIYGSEQKLRQWTTLWDNFVGTLAQRRNDVRHRFFEPAPGDDGVPVFTPRAAPRSAAELRHTG